MAAAKQKYLGRNPLRKKKLKGKARAEKNLPSLPPKFAQMEPLFSQHLKSEVRKKALSDSEALQRLLRRSSLQNKTKKRHCSCL